MEKPIKPYYLVIMSAAYEITVRIVLAETEITERIIKSQYNQLQPINASDNYIVLDILDDIMEAKARAFDAIQDVKAIRRIMRYNQNTRRETGFWYDIDGEMLHEIVDELSNEKHERNEHQEYIAKDAAKNATERNKDDVGL